MSTAAADSPFYGSGYALAAYIVIFATMFAYIGWMHVCHRRLSRRLSAVERALTRESRSRG